MPAARSFVGASGTRWVASPSFGERRIGMTANDSRARIAALPAESFAFVWKDFSRYVEVHPVQTGWLVVWGRYEDQGRHKLLLGNRTYPTLAGARRRFADAALALTRTPHLVADGLTLFDRHPFPDRAPVALPEPL